MAKPNVVAVDEKVKQAQALLEERLTALQSPDEWKEALRAMAHLGPAGIGRLSFGNILLLRAQIPGVTHAATFNAWRKLGRPVKKGEKGSVILRPRLVKTVDRSTGEEAHKLIGFSYLTVFGSGQTDGAPLPSVPSLKSGSFDAPQGFAWAVEHVRAILSSLDSVSSLTLRSRRPGDPHGAAGWYVPHTKEIVVITDGATKGQQLRVIFHEVAHSLLHPVGDRHSRPVCEVEAESVAFVVATAIGLDTSADSLPYVAGWAIETEDETATQAVQRAGERIRKAAARILEVLMPQAPAEADQELAAAA